MSYSVGAKRNLRTIRALRDESLTIDLGKTFEGTLEAWMKKDQNDLKYRSFDIQENRYLFLSREKTQDYYDIEDNLIESIKGRWYFDVRETPVGGTQEESKIVYIGTILFEENVTGGRGVESVNV